MGYSHDCIFFFIKIPLRQCHSAEQSGEWDSFPTVLFFFFSLKSLYDSVKGQWEMGFILDPFFFLFRILQ